MATSIPPATNNPSVLNHHLGNINRSANCWKVNKSSDLFYEKAEAAIARGGAKALVPFLDSIEPVNQTPLFKKLNKAIEHADFIEDSVIPYLENKGSEEIDPRISKLCYKLNKQTYLSGMSDEKVQKIFQKMKCISDDSPNSETTNAINKLTNDLNERLKRFIFEFQGNPVDLKEIQESYPSYFYHPEIGKNLRSVKEQIPGYYLETALSTNETDRPELNSESVKKLIQRAYSQTDCALNPENPNKPPIFSLSDLAENKHPFLRCLHDQKAEFSHATIKSIAEYMTQLKQWQDNHKLETLGLLINYNNLFFFPVSIHSNGQITLFDQYDNNEVNKKPCLVGFNHVDQFVNFLSPLLTPLKKSDQKISNLCISCTPFCHKEALSTTEVMRFKYKTNNFARIYVRTNQSGWSEEAGKPVDFDLATEEWVLNLSRGLEFKLLLNNKFWEDLPGNGNRNSSNHEQSDPIFSSYKPEKR